MPPAKIWGVICSRRRCRFHEINEGSYGASTASEHRGADLLKVGSEMAGVGRDSCCNRSLQKATSSHRALEQQDDCITLAHRGLF